MFKEPFLYLAIIVGGFVALPFLLPLAIFFGFPILMFIGVWAVISGLLGRLKNPAETAAVWATYLGILLTIQGILLAADIAIAGAPPSEEEKRFGRRTSYAGGSLAVVSAVAAFAAGRRAKRLEKAKPDTEAGYLE